MPKFKNGLSALQERFVREYLICLNASEAVRRAGYTSRRPDHTGHSLMKNPKIKARIEAEQERVIKKLDLTLESVINELLPIAFASIDGLTAEKADGSTVLDVSKLSELSAAQSAALRNKREALVDLGKHLGGFGSKVEFSGSIGIRHEDALDALE